MFLNRIKINFNVINILFSLLIIVQNIPAQELPPVRIYQLGDWISFKNCNFPTSLCVGREHIFFGTSGGVVPYQKYGKYYEEAYTVSDGLAADYITAVLYDISTNYLWASHEMGISFLTPTAEKWQNKSLADYLPRGNPVNLLGVGPNYIWAVAPGGFAFKFDKNAGFFLGQTSVNRLKDNIQWSRTKNDPLPQFFDYFVDAKYNFKDDGVIIDRELREFPVCLFYTDESQDIYGGVHGLGLLTGDDNIKHLNIYPSGPLQNHINALAISENTLWMGGEFQNINPTFNRNGVSAYHLSDSNWEYFESYFIPELVTHKILDIAYKNNHLWVGTTQGLSVFNTLKNSWKRYTMGDGLSEELIRSIALEDSIAWIGTQVGLDMVYLPEFVIRRVSLTPSKYHMKIYDIDIGKENIWIASDNGLYSVNRRDHSVSHFDISGNKIKLQDILPSPCRAVATSDSLVISIGRNSFLKYNLNKDKWFLLPELSGFYQVFDMVITNGYLWMGTDNGAILVRLSDFYQEHYSTADGLAGTLVFQIIPDGDIVWFATNNGLTKYQWRKYASANK